MLAQSTPHDKHARMTKQILKVRGKLHPEKEKRPDTTPASMRTSALKLLTRTAV
jgi:hypothetical protein